MASLQEAFDKYKVCVLVPTYNNALTLHRVLENLLEYTNTIIVVNDGSTDSTASIIQKFPQLISVGYPVNKGKGFALREGFKKAVEMGFDYAITIDSDGQHYPDDLPAFIRALEHNLLYELWNIILPLL
jgi:glycosyltransferase involved in cell wall biosynthesis